MRELEQRLPPYLLQQKPTWKKLANLRGKRPLVDAGANATSGYKLK